MDLLTLEIYSIVVKHLDQRSTTAALCRVSRSFQRAAQVVLYRSILADNLRDSLALCVTLAESPRLALLVESLIIIAVDDEASQSSDHDQVVENSASIDYWEWMKKALGNTCRLRSLDIEVHTGPTTAFAWIYPQGPDIFQLRTLRCDFDWDYHLATFLNTQKELEDLYIMDFKPPPITPSTITPTTAALEPLGKEEWSFDMSSMYNLRILECTFSEAASALIPGRPITHLKTCFSAVSLAEKQQEMEALLQSVPFSRAPLRALDIADSSYDQEFSMELLKRVAQENATRSRLKYFGTLVLPVDGASRLRFYGQLMRFPSLQCVEVEVSQWEPAPTSPAAFRALANELKLYCRLLKIVVFVLDLDRTIVTLKRGTSSWLVTEDDTDEYDVANLWREV